MRRHPGRQRGMTLLGMAFAAFLLGFFTLLVLKIGPIYLEHYKVVSSLKSLEQMPDLAGKSRREVRTLLEKRLDINMVENVTGDDIQVSREDGVTTVTVTYAVEKPLIGNLSVVVYFDDRIEVTNP